MKENPKLKWIEEAISSRFLTHLYLESGNLTETSGRFSYFRASKDSEENIFDLASLTKALVTTPLIYQCVEDKLLNWDTRIGDIFPKTFPSLISNARIDRLLAHNAGLPAWRNFWINALNPDLNYREARKHALELVKDVLNRVDLSEEKQEVYSDLGFILLGCVLEEITGNPLETLFTSLQSSVSNSNLHFPGTKLDQSNYIPTSFCKIRERVLKGEVHDENCGALGGVAGHAGIFGTGKDVSCWLRALSGTEIGQKIINDNSKSPPGHLKGWRRADDYSSEVFGSGFGIGHMGFTGTAFWIDPRNLNYGIVLTNRICSGRVDARIKEFRRTAFSYLQSIVDESSP